jgi:hypothetical protein
MLKDLWNQKCAQKKKATLKHVDSENIKLKICDRPLLTFFKIHKMWLKLAKIDRFSFFLLAIFSFFRSGKHNQ